MTQKHHLDFLDGLRGLAAAAVVLFHIGGRTDLSLIKHGYLAVDFFFVLSGLVVAHAYENRLATTMSPTKFTALRLVRLLPLLAAGTLIGGVFEFWRPGIIDHGAHYRDIVVATVLGSVAIPIPVSLSLEQVIFPINGPGWSLFFEIFINIAFAVFIKAFLNFRLTATIAVACGLVLLLLALRQNTIDQGARLDDWLAGFPRVGYSFFAGVLINRHRPNLRIPGWALASALLALLLVPALPAPWNGLYDALAVLVLFPLIVSASANVSVSAKVARLCAFGGLISYPIYALHYPLVRVASKLLMKLPEPQRLFGAVGVLIGLIAVSFIVQRLFDQPVRQFLGAKLRARSA